MLNPLTLPTRPKSELEGSTRQIQDSLPDLRTAVLPMLMQRFADLRRQEIMVIAAIPREEIRHTRANESLVKSRQEGEADYLALRHLSRRCGSLTEATTPSSSPYPWCSLNLWRKSCSISSAPTTSAPGGPRFNVAIHPTRCS